ncbi:hypothetical protein Y032_0095g2817 [Ancylostoma ceylanicum]|uniref:Uncharacterized protein n=1 Tax=Ancylostoma ceylanicum TaxID=53326 RepID=A0A016TKF4_9BILA|nr:hypothetical protein Y032_0095g2817 [Ancylostoma ceylanicum]
MKRRHYADSVRERYQSIIARGVQQTTRVPQRAAPLVRIQLAVLSSLYLNSKWTDPNRGGSNLLAPLNDLGYV